MHMWVQCTFLQRLAEWLHHLVCVSYLSISDVITIVAFSETSLTSYLRTITHLLACFYLIFSASVFMDELHIVQHRNL